jgi:HK97 family phage portal protein
MVWPFKKRAALPPFAVTTGGGVGPLATWAGATVDADAAMRLSAVWACVRLLSDTVSTLPVDVYRKGERGPITTPPVLVEPAAGQPLHEWLYACMVSLLLRGNFFAVVTARSGPGMLPGQLEPVHPDKVGVQVNEDGTVTYRVLGRELPREDVFHIRAYVMPGQILGLSPVEYARQSIGLGLAAEQFGGQFFGDGATPTGLLTTSDVVNPDQVQLLSEMWHSARSRRRGTAVLTGGVQWQPIQIAPNESQFLDSQRFTVNQVARVFGVPASMVGGQEDNSLTYATTESRAIDFLRYSLNPWLVRLEAALGRLLPRTMTVKFNADGLLRSTTKERYEAHAIALKSGFLSVNEVRELEDLPPVPGGETPPAPSGNGSGVPQDTVTVA